MLSRRFAVATVAAPAHARGMAIEELAEHLFYQLCDGTSGDARASLAVLLRMMLAVVDNSPATVRPDMLRYCATCLNYMGSDLAHH